MDLLKIFNSISIKDIQSYVEDSIEEDLFLEFKTVNHPTEKNNEWDKKNLSKCMSGFANSLGGIIVWGIKAAENDKGIDAAKDFKPIEQLSKLSNWFKRIEGQAVTPSIIGVRHRKITEYDDTGYLITYVPPSEDSPHIANYADKYYYKRSGDSFHRCEHYDIVDMFNRKKIPNLEVKLDILKWYNSGSNAGVNHYNFSAVILIRNNGKAIAKYPRLLVFVHAPYSIANFGLDGNGGRGMKPFPTVNFSKGYYGGNEIVIHQESEIQVDKIELKHITSEDNIYGLTLDYEVEAEGAKKIKASIEITKDKIVNALQKIKTTIE